MKFMKVVQHAEKSVRVILSEDGENTLGIVGRIDDLIAVGVLKNEDNAWNHCEGFWLCIPLDANREFAGDAGVGESQSKAVGNARFPRQ